MSIEAKRLDSLARNRASAELKRRHPEEWEAIRAEIHHELKVEQYVLGDVVRSRNEPLHFDNNGECDFCGKPSPCEQMRKRERDKVLRKQEPVPMPPESQ